MPSSTPIEQAFEKHFEGQGLSHCDVKAAKAFVLDLAEMAPPAEKAVLVENFLPAFDISTDPSRMKGVLDALVGMAERGGFKDAFTNHDARVIERHYADFTAMANGREKNGPRVVFLAHAPYFLILREAIHLKRFGYRVFLVSLGEISAPLRPLFEDHFDAVADLQGNYRLLRALLAKLEPDVFHVQCWMWFTILGRMAIEAKGSAAVICEFYDVTSVYADRDVLATNWPPGVIDFEFAMEDYVLHHGDGVITRFPDFVIGEWRDRFGAMPPHLRMQAYPCPEFIAYGDEKLSAGDGVTRLVYAGSVIPLDARNPPALFPETGMPRAFRSLLEQGLAIDVLHDPNSPLDEADPRIGAYMDLARAFPLFRFKKGVPPDRLAEASSVYDYGLLLFDYDASVVRIRESQRRGVVATKIFTYLEAGLPVLVNAEYEEMARIVSENGLGLAIHSRDLDRVADKLSLFDYEKSVQNIHAFNERHGMDKEIGRLVDFYGRLGVK